MGHIACIRMFKVWLAFDFIFKLSKYYEEWIEHRNIGFGFVADVIKENEENFQKGREQIKMNTLVDLLYQIRGTMSYDEMVQSVFLMVAAGFETSGGSIPHILLLLAMNPEHQEKCYQEISSVLTSPDGEVTEKVLKECNHLDNCIKEGLRLITPVLVLSRKVKEDLNLG